MSAKTRTKRVTKAMHPGWACCDLSQDLAGWIARERARIARNWRWSRVLRQRGDRLGRASLAALVAGDQVRADELAANSRGAHGRANAFAQYNLIAEGQVNRVEAAHQWRLSAEVAA